MDNNKNLNNQVNENNGQPELNNNVQPVIKNSPVDNNPISLEEKPKNNNNLLIILFVLIILGVGGYFAYTKLIAKNEPKQTDVSTPTPSPTNTQKTENVSKDITEEYLEQYTVNQKVTYKSKDGKNVLVIEPDGENLKFDYNGKIIEGSVSKLGKYLLVEAAEKGQFGQCGKYNYIINSETNTLVDLYTNNLLTIIKLNDNYYFKEYICAKGDVAIYDDNLNKIGTKYIVADKKYFYIFDGNIVKYDADGKIVLKTNEVYNLAKYDDFDAMMDETGVYILIVSNGEIFFIDTNVENMKSIKIGPTSEYNYYFGGEGDLSLSPTEDGKININLFDKQNKSLDIVYDIKTKTIQK